MNNTLVGECLTLLANAATAAYLLVKKSAGNWVICGATDRPDAVVTEGQLTSGQPMAAQLLIPNRVYRMQAANVTIAVDDPIFQAANGLVTNVWTAGAAFIGIAYSATAANGIFMVMVKPLRRAVGQSTTASASDTIVTGLTKVLSCVANLDSAPVLTCDRATASLGDQAGTPAAGSILLQTWMPTSNANPTPIAATTFTKKVNWIAEGY